MTELDLLAGTLDVADLHASLTDPLLDTMNFLNEVTSRYPDAISFGPGRPHEERFDGATIAGYLDAYTEHLARDRGLSTEQISRALFQYGRTNGQIHDLIAATVRNDEGIEADPESLVVTVGAQEGMLLVLRALIRDAADVLLVAAPCYVGITGVARLLDVAVEPVPEGPDGVQPATLLAAIDRVRASGRRPRALYLVPDFANPSGSCMPVAARTSLLEIAAREELLLIEDNPYGFFSRTGEQRPTLKQLDTARRVVYLGSFAKTCLPGARVGYVIADQRVRAADGTVTRFADELSKIKSMTTVNTPALSQALIGGMLLRAGCRLRETNQGRIALYRDKLDALLAALERYFPPAIRDRLGVRWNTPAGGFFLVVTVPFDADDAVLTRSARDHGVVWTPMSYFSLDGGVVDGSGPGGGGLDSGGRRQIRLSCSYLSLPQIDEGVARLSAFVATQVAC